MLDNPLHNDKRLIMTRMLDRRTRVMNRREESVELVIWEVLMFIVNI